MSTSGLCSVLATMALSGLLLVSPRPLVAQDCCGEFNGGHDCNGWRTEYDCDHTGFVHSGCEVHSDQACGTGFTLKEAGLQQLELALTPVLNAVARSGDPRFLVASLDLLRQQGMPRIQLSANAEQLEILNCQGEVVQEVALSDFSSSPHAGPSKAERLSMVVP